MIATLLHREGIHTTHLPEKTHGQHWLHTSPQPSEATRAISIEGIESDREGEDGYWLITTNQDADILDNNGNTIESCALQPFTMYPLRLRKTGAKALLYIEPATLGRQQYRKYRAADNAIVSIGRHEGNTIVINSPYVSEYHARIDTSVNSWSIISDGINGTCVNGKRVKEKALRTGDSIAILAGCKIIVAGNIIAINNPDGKVRVKTDLLKPIEETRPKPSSDDDANNTSITLFSRSPRFEQEFKPPTFKIEAPPPNQLGEQTPIMMTLGPALTMGLASSTMLIFAVVNGMSRGNLTSAIPMIAMSVSMLCGVVLWPILSRKHNKKNRQQKEALRQEKYSAYLQDFSNSLTKECRRQEEYRRKTCVHINECISRIENRERTLWERRPGQDDFLTLRIGLGEQELQANVNFPEDKFTLEDDHLKKQLLDICQARHPLHSVPMTISLLRDPISGVIGDRRQVIEHIKGLIIQTAALYSYDEVKLAVFYDIEEENHFGFTKWLPHIWDNTRSFRLLARTDGEMKEISAYFEQVIDHRIQTGERDMDAAKPHYIILSLSHTLAKKTDILKRIYAQKKDLHISVLTAYNKLSNLPIESTLVVELYNPETSMTGELSGEVSRKLADKSKDSQDAANKTTYYAGLPVAGKYYTQDNPGVVTPFTPDIQVRTDTRTSPAKLALQLANTHLDTLAAAFQLPTTLTFLEMFSVGKLQHLNILARWQENDPTKTLEAPIGMNAVGELFKLDLHEKFHGPHGLVAGMTGSGKSEFIMAFILSLAVNYHPHEVAFILIDYKGGGMAKSFENLPHTAGIITNLDGAALNRSLVSIQSELKRRQAIFADTGKRLEISNIDIYKYQELYRRHVVTEPLQHLILIADEFAELRTQQPEFMTQLVSAARIGRSLGIHLILATQKPAGVVDDQIWSNSRFRVCLKVQDKADSQDMLKRPDAAELTQAGRFYLQVGYNELFEMGQSAWAGAPYYPQDRFTPEKDDAVVIIDSNGRPIRAAKPDKRDSRLANPKKQLDAITEYLKATADKENISIRPLWLEPIPAIIFLDDIKRNNNGQFKQGFNLNPIIGQYDDPSRQRQCTLTLPLTAEGNTIIYGSAGSGKTTFLNALITSLTQDHTPDEVNIYILDFSAETLRAFAQAPHIGDVVFSFEAEKIENLLRMLREETHNRKALFADYGGDFITYMKTTQPESRTPNLDQRPPNPDQHPPKPEPRIPSIVLIIHDFGIFSDIYEHKLRDIMNLTRESAKYGIYVILTALSINAVRAVIRQNFKQLFSLQMNEAEDYFSIVGKTEGLLPAKHKGRGLVRLDGLYEYQIAHLTEDPIPYGFIQTHSRQLQDRYPDVAAPPIPIMPEHITPEDLAAHIQFNTKEQTNLAQLTLPIGIECDTIKVHNYPFGRNPVSLVVSAQPETHFLQELATLAANHCGITTVIIDPTGTLAPKDTGALICVSSKETCENVIKSLGNLLTNRLSTGETSASQGQKHEPLIVIITAYTPLQNIITEEARGDLILFLERTSITHNTISIIGELAQDIGKTAMTPWYAKHSPGTAQNYIWAGSGLKEQYTQAITPRPTTEQSSLSPEFAYSISKGRQMTKIKLLGASSDNGQ